MKKSVVLQADSGKEKAVLTIESKDDMLVGRVRLYNFSEEPKGILSLGFNSGGKVVKAGLTKSASMLYTFQTDIENVNEKFSCAVINSFKGTLSPLLYGSSEGKGNKEEVLANALEVYDKPLTIEAIKDSLEENGIEYSQQLQDEIDEKIEEELHDKCENCKYKKCFYEKDIPSFYAKLKTQIDRLFENNPEEEYLEKIIPNSKWVKVEYEKEGDYYVIGLVYENEDITYLCYGIPGVYQKNPPKELSGYPVWLPLDSDKKEGFGYWLAYQNAETGESIKAIIE